MANEWRITRGEEQFVASSLDELKEWAEGGKIRPDDIVLAPDSGRHVYAVEIDQLGPVLAQQRPDDDDEFAKKGVSVGVYRSVLVLTALIMMGTVGALAYAFTHRPDPTRKVIYDPKQPGIHGSLLAYEALVTADAVLRSEPDANSASVAPLLTGRKVELKAKHGHAWYKVETSDGQTGYVALDEVVPGYFFDRKARARLDPIFSPDNYIKLVNYSWEPDQNRGAKKFDTLFGFNISNTSPYPMDRIVIRIHIQSEEGDEEQIVDVPVPEQVPPDGFHFLEGIKVNVDYKALPKATVEVIEARAVLGHQEDSMDVGSEGAN